MLQIIIAATIAVVVVVIAVGIGIPLAQKTLAQPRMTLTDVSASHSWGSCNALFFPAPPQYYTFYFTIHNTGDADGFALVVFRVGEAVWSDRYFVPAHGNVEKDATVQIDDCESHSWNVEIPYVEKV